MRVRRCARSNLAFNWQYVWTSPYTGSWALNVTGATNSALVVTANLTACGQVRTLRAKRWSTPVHAPWLAWRLALRGI